MPKVILMRHAKTTLNQEGRFAGITDCNITEEGAKLAKESFAYTNEDFDYIYVSPLKRTSQTLDAIMPEHIEPIIDDRIIERNLGDWEATPYTSHTDNEIQMYVKGYIDPPKAETFSHIRSRAESFINDLFNKYDKNDRILVITHGGLLRQVRDLYLPKAAKGEIGNAGIIVVTNEDYETYIKSKQEAR